MAGGLSRRGVRVAVGTQRQVEKHRFVDSYEETGHQHDPLTSIVGHYGSPPYRFKRAFWYEALTFATRRRSNAGFSQLDERCVKCMSMYHVMSNSIYNSSY